MAIESYPLYWPEGWPRTKYPQHARFQTKQNRAQMAIVRELNLLGATNIIISTNQEIRRDGLPYVNQSRMDDVGVAVYFDRDGSNQCIPCDKWLTLADNMQAIAKTIEALRGLERWGAKDMVDAAFRGFKALPESVIVTEEPWYTVLGVEPDAPASFIRNAYRDLVKKHHPDIGGDPKEFERIQNAYKKGMV